MAWDASGNSARNSAMSSLRVNFGAAFSLPPLMFTSPGYRVLSDTMDSNDTAKQQKSRTGPKIWIVP